MVITGSGTVYSLVGDINETKCKANDISKVRASYMDYLLVIISLCLPQELVNIFRHGFPEDWEQQVCVLYAVLGLKKSPVAKKGDSLPTSATSAKSVRSVSFQQDTPHPSSLVCESMLNQQEAKDAEVIRTLDMNDDINADESGMIDTDAIVTELSGLESSEVQIPFILKVRVYRRL